MDGHGPARTRPTHLGYDVARGRVDGDLRLDLPDLDRAADVHQGALLAPGGRDRPGDRLPADRADRGRRRRGPSRGVPPGVGVQQALRRGRPRDQPPRGRRAVPGCAHGRHPRGLPHAHRRPGEPGGRHDGAGEGRTHARGDPAGGHACCGRPGARWSRRRRAHRGRDHRVRPRRQRCRDVGPPARRTLRCEHPAPSRRALLPDHRRHARGRSGLAGAGGPEPVHLHPTRGRRPDGRPVRDRVRTVERGTDPRGLLVRCHHPGLGSDGSLRRGRDGSGAGHPGRRDPHVLLRARVVHARPAADHRRGPRGAQLLRRRGAELDRDPHRWRLGPGDRALDHHRLAGHRCDGREHRPAAPAPDDPSLPGHAHRREPRDGLRVPLPGPLDANGPGREAIAAARPDGCPGRVVRGGLRVGGAGMVRR